MEVLAPAWSRPGSALLPLAEPIVVISRNRQDPPGLPNPEGLSFPMDDQEPLD
jgi:hypothetical protein